MFKSILVIVRGTVMVTLAGILAVDGGKVIHAGVQAARTLKKVA